VNDGKASASDTVDITVMPGMGGADAGADGGDTLTPSSGAGCDCATSGDGSGAGAGAAASLLALAAMIGRRRRARR
jgi:MYXO-CTERM domain-containing protein